MLNPNINWLSVSYIWLNQTEGQNKNVLVP